jgi:hypothetical protein
MAVIWSPFMLLMKRRSLNEVSMEKNLKLKSNLKVDLEIVSNKS